MPTNSTRRNTARPKRAPRHPAQRLCSWPTCAMPNCPRSDADHERSCRQRAARELRRLRRARRAYYRGNEAALMDALLRCRQYVAPVRALLQAERDVRIGGMDRAEAVAAGKMAFARRGEDRNDDLFLVPLWALLGAQRAVSRKSLPGLVRVFGESEIASGRHAHFLARWRDDMADWHRYQVVSRCREAIALGWPALRGDTPYSMAAGILAGTPAATESSSLEKAYRRVAGRLRAEPERYYQPGFGPWPEGMGHAFGERLYEVERFIHQHAAGTNPRHSNPPHSKVVRFK